MVNQRQVQKYSNEMLADLFNQAVDPYGSRYFVGIKLLTRLHFNTQDKFVRLIIQARNSAIRHVNQN